VSADLLTAYAVGGGIPPATSETLRVYENGVARAVVGNAWPFGAPQDEAGSYEQRLDRDEMAALRATLDQVPGVAEPPGPIVADSGRCWLRFGDGRELAWPTTAPPPEPLVLLVERLRDLLAHTRLHPLGALAVALEPPVPAPAGAPLALGIRLINPGREPIWLAQLDDPGRIRVRATAVDGDPGGHPDLERLMAAEPLAVEPGDVPAQLAPGEHVTIAGRMSIPTAGGWRLDVLARLAADVPYEGERLRLECVALAGPVVARVDP
jgi:hypothetical protein